MFVDIDAGVEIIHTEHGPKSLIKRITRPDPDFESGTRNFVVLAGDEYEFRADRSLRRHGKPRVDADQRQRRKLIDDLLVSSVPD